MDWLFSLAMAAATITTAMAPQLNLGSTAVVSMTVLGGVALGWTYLRWGLFYSTVDLRQAVVFIFVAGIVWSLLDVVMSLLPLKACCAFIAVLPFASTLMLRKAKQRTPKSNSSTRLFPPSSLVAMWKVWAVILSVSLVTSTFIASGTALPPISVSVFAVINFCLITILSLFIVIWALKTSLPFDFPLLWRLMTFVLAVGLVLAAIAPDSLFVTVFFRSAPGILIPTTWLTVCEIAKHSGANRRMVIGFGLGAYSLASFLGIVVVGSFSGIVDLHVISTVLLFLLFIVSGLCLETRDPDIRKIFEDLNEPMRIAAEFSTIDERCDLLGRQYLLTEREIEVMQMVCKGRSRSFIAEALVLSENTVKSHVSHIYAKLGIHSKRDLQRLIDS